VNIYALNIGAFQGVQNKMKNYYVRLTLNALAMSLFVVLIYAVCLVVPK